VLACVPRTQDVMVLFERLQTEFPGGVGELAGGVKRSGVAGGLVG